jgi:hypothetical protein
MKMGQGEGHNFPDLDFLSNYGSILKKIMFVIYAIFIHAEFVFFNRIQPLTTIWRKPKCEFLDGKHLVLYIVYEIKLFHYGAKRTFWGCTAKVHNAL